MNFSLYIAKRYLFAKSKTNVINIITKIAAVGVILGTASLFIVLSGFSGLKEFTLQFTTIVDPDLKAVPDSGKSFVVTPENIQKLKKLNEITHFSKVIEERVYVTYENKDYPNAFIKGVDAAFEKVNAVDSIIPLGNWLTQDTNEIVVGWGVSTALSISVLDYGKRITLYVPKPGTGQITNIKQAYTSFPAQTVGIFDINPELNDTYIFAPINFAKSLLNYKENEVTAIEFKRSKNTTEEQAIKAIKKVLGNKVALKNRMQLNDALYKMLNTENLAVYLIFTLVLIIALFNVIGSIIMMILDKKQNLVTLFNLGATQKDIRKIFLYQGILMTFLGGVLGLLLGSILIFLQSQFSLVMITPSLPYPVLFKISNLLIVFVTIMILGIIASKIASSRVNR